MTERNLIPTLTGVSVACLLAIATACGDGAVEPVTPVTPPTPVPTTITVSPASATLQTLGETAQLAAEVRDQNGQAMANAAVAWTSSDPSVATVAASGLVTAVANGAATVTATAGSASGTAAVTVDQVVASVAVHPAADTMPSLGDTLRLSAEALDANGNVVAGGEFAWASSDTSVATVDASGLVTAVANGVATVTATAGSASGTAAVTVDQVVASVAVSPSADTLPSLGDTLRLSAEALDANGNAVADAEFAWESSDPSVATVDPMGLVTASANGAVTVTARVGSASGTVTVTVDQVVASVAVSPSADTLPALGDTLRLSAEALDANGNAVADAEFAWESSDPSVATVDRTGLVTAAANGAVTVTARVGSASGTVTVTVDQVVASVAVSPSADTLPALGDTLRLSAEALDANGNAVADAEFAWESSDPSVATVDATGLVTASANGAVTVTARVGSASGTVTVTVDQVVASVTVSPSADTLPALGDTLRLSAEALDANGNAVADAEFAWESSDPSVATVDPMGLVTASANGAVTVTARAGSASGTVTVTVDQVVASVAMDPAADTLPALGDTLRLSAEALDANGNAVADAEFAWESSDPSVATVDATGLVTAAANGAAAVTATAGSASGTVMVTVDQVVASVSVDPVADTLPALGDTLRLSAAALDANGNAVADAEFAWESSDPSVATVDATGLVTAVANGSTTVTASYGSVSAGVPVAVEQQVASVLVSPSSTTLAARGDTVRLTAEGVDANANPVAAVQFEWMSDDHAVATVSATGLVTAVGNGSATVTVGYNKLGATVAVAVVDVAQFLEENSRIANAMVWLDTGNRLRPYTRWPRRMQEGLALAVVELLGDGTGLPDVPINRADGYLADDEFAITVLSRRDAEDIYLANIAHSLMLEMDNTLPWSLDDLSDRQLEMLLGSEGFFVEYGRVIRGVPEGYIVNGRTGPAPPEIIRDFIEDRDLVRGSRYQTIARTVEWTRHHLSHYSCWLTAANAENHWNYRGTPPLARMLSGTNMKRDGVLRWGERECRTYAHQHTEHYTAGCHGTAWFFLHVLRAVNIPVEPPEYYYAVCASHAAVSFPSENVYLSHGDDPYNKTAWYSPPFSEPFPSSDLLIPGSQFREWFNSSHSDEENLRNVGRTVAELAVAHLPQLLLSWRCWDLAEGLPKESGRVYRPGSTGIGHFWTVAELEAMRFWERLDAKIAQYGGCPIPEPSRWDNRNKWPGTPSAGVWHGAHAPLTDFSPAGSGRNVCWIDPRYLHLVQRNRTR